MTINERLDIIIKELFNGNKSAFAAALGVTPSTVENIVGKRQGKPSYDLLEKIYSIENINIDWLFTGKGVMLKAKTAPNAYAEVPATTSIVAEPSATHSFVDTNTIAQLTNTIGQLTTLLTDYRKENDLLKISITTLEAEIEELRKSSKERVQCYKDANDAYTPPLASVG